MSGRPKKSFFLNANVDIDTSGLRYPDAAWDSEWQEVTGWRYYLDMFVDSAVLEIGVGLCIIADLAVTLSVLIWLDEEQAESLGIFVASALLVLILFLDMVLRVLKEGRYFFYKPLNWVEFVVAVGGAGLMFWEASRRAGVSNGSASGAKGSTSLGRSIRPVMRILRVLRATMQLLVSRGGIQGYADRTTDRLADRLIRDKLGDLLLVPPANITMKPSQGIFHLEKAQVRTRVFEGLHLPFALKGGVIDLLHVDIDLLNAGQTSESKKDVSELNKAKTHRLLVILENVVVVAGPGHHQEPPLPPWDVKEVQEAKRKLVELVTRRLGETKKAKPATAGRQRRALIRWVQQRARMVVEEVLAHGMHVDLRNVELRYEDPAGVLLGGRPAIGGCHVDQLKLRGKGASQGGEVEEDLRSNGRWKRSKEERPLPVLKNLSEATVSQSSGGSRMKAFTSVSLSSQDSTASSKRSLRHGILGCLSVHGAKVFWDVDISAEGIAHQLQEGSDMLKFSKKRAHWLMMERVRHQLCLEIRRTLGVTSPHVARERARKLKETISGHRYIVTSCGFSAHVSMRPSVRPSATVWPPTIDVDVHLPAIHVSADLAQLSSALKLVEYLKKWMREDRKLQWKVSAWGDRGVQERVKARWSYAVLLVLQAIDPKYPWRSLAWMEMRRRTKLRREFVEQLLVQHQEREKKPQRSQAILELQTAMPLSDCVFSKQEAQGFIAAAMLDAHTARTNRCCRCVVIQSSEDVVERAASEKDLGDGREDLSMDPFLSQQKSSMESSRDVNPPSSPHGALEASQYRKCGQLAVVWDSFECFILGHPIEDGKNLKALARDNRGELRVVPRVVRRPVLRLQVEGVRFLAGKQCPLPIWRQIAPQSAVVKVDAASWCKDAVPPGVVMEAVCSNFLAVFCGAPSSCPKMRRMLGVRLRHPRASWTDANGNADRNTPGSPFAANRRCFTHDESANAGGSAASNSSARPSQAYNGTSSAELDRTPVRFNVAHMGIVDLDDVQDLLAPGNFDIRNDRLDKRKKEGIYWQFSASFPALEGNVFMPVLKRISGQVKSPPPDSAWKSQVTPMSDGQETDRTERQQNLVASTRPSSVQTATSVAHATNPLREDMAFSLKMAEAFKSHRDRRLLPNKRLRQSEKLMGLSGILQLSRLSGTVSVHNGVQGCVLQAYTTKTWFAQSTALPPGTVDVYRNTVPGMLSVGFSPTNQEESHGGQNGERENKRWGDECNVGADAYELEAACGLPTSAWRHRPSTSAHGLSLRVENIQRAESSEDVRLSRKEEPNHTLCGLSTGCGEVCSGEKVACFVTLDPRANKSTAKRQPQASSPTNRGPFSPRTRLGLAGKVHDQRHFASGRGGAGEDVSVRGIGVSVDILPSSALGLPHPGQLEELWNILGV